MDQNLLDVIWEVAKGLGQFFLHPLFYLGFVFAILLGYFRVKRERKDFNIRVQDGWFEFRTYLKKGWLLGILFSVVVFILGFTIPFEYILGVSLLSFILALVLKPSLLSPAYTMGITFFLFIFFSLQSLNFSVLTIDMNFVSVTTHLPGMAFLLGLLLVIESILIMKDGTTNTSPKVIKGKRGLKVAVHDSRRLWMVPLLVFLPNGTLSIPFDFWPVVPIGNEAFSVMLVPFWIGFGQQISISLPKAGVQLTGKRVLLLASLVTILAAVGFWYQFLSYIAVGIAIIGRLLIPVIQHFQNHNRAFYLSKKQSGIVIVDIIPSSPAEKMELKIGEIIKRVNGIAVENDREFYEALQKNRAFCKLEVIDTNGENRFVNRALYEGEHHELGVLFVTEEKRWEQDVI